MADCIGIPVSITVSRRSRKRGRSPAISSRFSSAFCFKVQDSYWNRKKNNGNPTARKNIELISPSARQMNNEKIA